MTAPSDELFALLPAATLILSSDEHSANPAAQQLLGEQLPLLVRALRDIEVGALCRSVELFEQRLPLGERWVRVQARAWGERVLCTVTDQTRHAELERSEIIFKTTERMGKIGGWELDLRSQSPIWSDEVYRIHGVEPGRQPSLDDAISAYAPEARPVIEDAVQKALAGGGGWDLELPFIGFDNRRRWVRAIGQVLKEEGEISRVFGAFQDITVRKNEIALREALTRTQQHEALFEGINVLLGIANMEGAFIEVNGSWERLLGYTAEEMCAQSFLAFVHPDDIDKTIAEIELLKRPGYQTASFVNRYRKKDGDWVTLRWYSSPDEAGERVYAVAHDITDELEIQQKLKRLAMIASRTDNAVLVTDARGHTQWANEAFTRITGYHLSEVLGRKPGELLQGPDSDPETIRQISVAVRRGEPFAAELINYRRDGTPYWVSIEGQPLFDDAGELTGFMAIESDITKQKQAEQELIAARDAAEAAAAAARAATQAKSAFLAMMSHELRTPMNGILGTAQLLAQTPLNDEQAHYIEIVQSSGRGLLTLLNDILDFSKIEAGHMELTQASFSLPRCLQEVTDLYASSATESGLRLRLECSPALPALVLGDELRLRQVLSNLIGNAIKFTDQGEVVVRAAPDGERVRISVQDTGVGISAADQSELFQAFRQLDTSAQRRFQGTGLGLAICDRLVSLMEGQLGVDSQPGVGSTFWLSIPLPETAQAQACPEVIDAALLSGMSVLLVEDNPINQLVASRMLETLGCAVSLADNGQQAIDALSKGEYALVLMDCHMPTLDGWSATQQLRASGYSHPIVALTASVMPEDIERCRLSGMDDYLSKPLDITTLQRTLQRWGLRAMRRLA